MKSPLPGMFAAVVCVGSWAQAADPLAVELLAADGSLLGWEYGAQPPRGWTIEGGVLRGDASATPLVGGWTLGDFELSFDWGVDDGGVWTIGLAPPGDGTTFEIALCGGEGCGAVRAGETVLAEGKPKLLAGDRLCPTIIRRFERMLEVVVDGTTYAKVDLADAGHRLLRLALARGRGALSSISLDEPLGAPVLTTGVDGWRRTSEGRAWTWVEGEVRAPGDGSNYLRSDEEFENFLLTLEYKQPAGGNSGIGIRTPAGGWPSGDGMELQLYDQPDGKPLNKQSTAAIYGNVEPVARADRADAWNRVVVRAEGFLISMWVNGRLVQHCNTRDCPELKYRNLRGWIGLQDHNDPARFRNVHIKRLPDGLGPDAWYAPRPEPASRLVLEPLMNSERIAEASGVEWETEEIDLALNPSRQQIGMRGPGAVVGVSADRTGTMRIALDGAPSRQFSWGELPADVPQLAAGLRRITYLPFDEQAAVELLSDEPAMGLLAFARFSPEARLDQAPERGLMSAISYRLQQLGHGRHRQGDPLPMIEGPVEALAPGESREIRTPETRGVVKRLVVRAGPELLADDALWLEIDVDGETAPAISAPARYFFPGLGQGPYENFVATRSGEAGREGFVSLLGMPFAGGLAARLVNRGEGPVADVGLQLVFDTEESRIAASIDGGLRLRGAFIKGDGDPPPTGPGRWIGIVARALDDGTVPTLDLDAPPAVQWGLSSVDGEERGPLSGRAEGLVWRWMLVDVWERRVPIALNWRGRRPDHLLLYYGSAP